MFIHCSYTNTACCLIDNELHCEMREITRDAAQRPAILAAPVYEDDRGVSSMAQARQQGVGEEDEQTTKP